MNKKNYVKAFSSYHLPLILYAATVIGLSSTPHFTIKHLKFLAFDKFAHFIEYAIFSVLAFRSFSFTFGKDKVLKALTISWLFLLGFAFFDELYQSLIPGRDSDINDFLTDIVGASLVLILLSIRNRKLYKNN